MKIKMKSNLQAGYVTPGAPAASEGDIIEIDESRAMNLIGAGFAEAVNPMPAKQAPEVAAIEPAESADMPRPARKSRAQRSRGKG